MKILFRAPTRLGPRTVTIQSLDADTASALAATLEGFGCAVTLCEDEQRTSWREQLPKLLEKQRREKIIRARATLPQNVELIPLRKRAKS